MRPVVTLDRVTKRYGDLVALDEVTLAVPQGRFVAVMGPSGSGKSTLLHCAAALDRPTSGTVKMGGTDVGRLSETKRTVLRRKHAGFVFQSYNLLPAISVQDNITLPLRLAGVRPDREWLDELVHRVGLRDRLHHKPAALSGGQQQRAAIVRALAARPDVVFADEPTGALDLRSAGQVLDLLRELVDELGQTVVMVTHDPAAATRAHETLVMADGRVIDVLDAPAPEELAVRLTRLAGGEPVR
ncbi:ABC transporter ATP-binding protein [Nonomuraea jiangxiensis]|uniref:Putative ABC transport system ATP-binding protein n=1 Tax=Nonomuraea jiangxiensis TaxID=633440 RepID=A0A1G9IBE6_9ACTN|nr:ABC transporter ATP-binding protein [Nonomuraea jiangxiensis]SDL22529.1 putative ABC transport system ATP-binding protein [Nonomuraea jiangxiensis]